MQPDISSTTEEIGAEWLGEAPSAYRFYDGTVTLYFDKDSHRYYRYDAVGNEITVSGVTTAVHIIDKSAALLQWAANLACDYIGQKWADLNDPFLNPDSTQFSTELLDTWLADAKFAHRDYKEKAAGTGKLAHDWIEQYIKALIVTNGVTDSPALTKIQNEMPEDERAVNGIRAALDWMNKHKVRWVYTERKIYSKRHDFAGTLDGLAYVTACGDKDCCGHWEDVPDIGYTLVADTFVDELMVIDWKTSNALYREYHYQTAAYTKALMEEIAALLGAELKYRIIIRLGKEDAEFEQRLLYPDTLESDFQAFVECLALYNTIEAAKETEREHKKRAKEAKAAAKEREEAAIKARKALKKEWIAEARLKAKLLYTELRAQKVPVVDATQQSDAFLADAFQKIAEEFVDFTKAEEVVEVL